jgi:L-arabinokinase
VTRIVFYVTGHGFGHASRVIEVINALFARRSDLEIHVRTTAARWLFDLTTSRPVVYHDAACDTGVVQIDSLRPDIPATVERAARFHGRVADRIAPEAAWLSRTAPALVVADIPPIALAAAHAAGIPAVGFSNFTWDWIYEGYRDALGGAAWLPGRLADLQSTAREAWRLPMHGGFGSYRAIVDVPFVARHARRSGAEVRDALGLEADRPVALVSFGGVGQDGLPLGAVAADSGFRIVTTAPPADLRTGTSLARQLDNGVVQVDERALYAGGWRYEDLVGASDVVVTKPGYGIIAEAVANGAALLYTSRGRFAEYDVLVREMPRYLRCRFISNDDLLGGRWAEPLARLLAQGPAAERPATNGAEVVAGRALELAGLSAGPSERPAP